MEQNQQNQQDQQKSQQDQTAENQKNQKENKPFVIGVIVNDGNHEDIQYYNDSFRHINSLFKNQVRLVFFGYDPEKDKNNILEGVEYEYVKPVSIIHYFKQLKSLKLNLLFIPLINNVYNQTSENYNKYLEASVFSIPIITVDIFPYNVLIKNDMNGFIYPSKEKFIGYLKELLSKKQLIIPACGNFAFEQVKKEFNYGEKTAKELLQIFS